MKYPVSLNISLVFFFCGTDSDSPKCLGAKIIMKKYSGALIPDALS